MSYFLYVNDDDNLKKVNIDDLYENKQRRDLKQISIFNKILNRIQHRITITGRNKKTDRHIFFNIPEFIFGEPLYDKGDCIGYVVSKLEDNGFFIRYIHPNTLFISWDNWVPSYVRAELKKKRGIIVDEKGNIIEKKGDGNEENDKEENINSRLFNDKNNESLKKEPKQYTPIGNYKPTGNLIYGKEMFDKLEKKIVL
jgi:hypothetical protein